MLHTWHSCSRNHLTSSVFTQCLAKIRTYYLHDDKQMRYMLSHGTQVKFVLKIIVFKMLIICTLAINVFVIKTYLLWKMFFLQKCFLLQLFMGIIFMTNFLCHIILMTNVIMKLLQKILNNRYWKKKNWIKIIFWGVGWFLLGGEGRGE